MLFWRAIEEFAGAGLTMWWRASVYLLIPRQNRSKSLMRISVMLYLGTAAGLLYSGYVTDNLDWRLIFVPDMIVAAAAIGLLRRHFPEVPASSDQRIAGVDKAGIALLAVALISAQIVMSRGEIDDWFGSPEIQTLSWTAAGALLLLFVGWQLSARNAVRLLRLDLVRDRQCAGRDPARRLRRCHPLGKHLRAACIASAAAFGAHRAELDATQDQTDLSRMDRSRWSALACEHARRRLR
jgi:MFS family permease